MALIVQKFGGTSLGTPERIKNVADRIAATRKQGKSVVVVVSAMGRSTDELIELAHQVSKNPPHREMDMLLTAGERVSMALLSMALADRKVGAMSFTGSQTGIITDESHRRARIKKILGNRVREALSHEKVAIVAGFQGVSESKEITTLGRGGSDTTAVALAAALKADLCEIFTDVDGIYSADPRVVAKSRFWKRIPHDLALEMATRGAGVLHPRAIELAFQFRVPLRVRNSLNENEGTTLTTETNERGMEEFSITGVTADSDKMLLLVELQRPTVLNAVWDRATQSHLQIVAPMFIDGKIWCFIERDAESDWKKHLNELSSQGFVKNYELRSDLAPVSVVGNRFTQDGTGLNRIIETLASHHISVTIGSSSALAMTVAVPVQHVDDSVRVLHAEWIEHQRNTKGIEK